MVSYLPGSDRSLSCHRFDTHLLSDLVTICGRSTVLESDRSDLQTPHELAWPAGLCRRKQHYGRVHTSNDTLLNISHSEWDYRTHEGRYWKTETAVA